MARVTGVSKDGSNGYWAFTQGWSRRFGAAVTAACVAAVTVAAAMTVTSLAASTPPAAVAVALAADASPLAAATPPVTFDQQMIQLVNQARATAKVPPLTQAKGLSQLALWWSAQEANGVTRYQLAHNRNAWTMVTRYGAANRKSWGENVAWSSSAASTARQIFSAYMHSPGHKANILSPHYRYIGMGTVSGSHGLFNTTEFTDAVQPGQAVTPPVPKAAPTFADGALIRDAGTGITDVMAGGPPVAFVSWAAFGYAKAATMLPHAVFLGLALYPANGAYLRSVGSG